jgi:hypothetical protein
VLLVIGREEHLRWERFGLVVAEGVLYAVAMRFAAAYVVGRLALAAVSPEATPLSALVASLGAGFYEELVFRVFLFGLGVRVVRWAFSANAGPRRLSFTVGWAVLCAVAFSGWHYVGEFADVFELRSFVFRAVCGLAFVVIYATRGFAPAVWTHALYDIWVLAL